jgi:hypothetical protein
MDTTSMSGLTITYDDETGTFSFDWNEETHPEYNFIADLTADSFSKMLQQYLNELDESNHVKETSKHQTEI